VTGQDGNSGHVITKPSPLEMTFLDASAIISAGSGQFWWFCDLLEISIKCYKFEYI